MEESREKPFRLFEGHSLEGPDGLLHLLVGQGELHPFLGVEGNHLLEEPLELLPGREQGLDDLNLLLPLLRNLEERGGEDQVLKASTESEEEFPDASHEAGIVLKEEVKVLEDQERLLFSPVEEEKGLPGILNGGDNLVFLVNDPAQALPGIDLPFRKEGGEEGPKGFLNPVLFPRDQVDAVGPGSQGGFQLIGVAHGYSSGEGRDESGFSFRRESSSSCC